MPFCNDPALQFLARLGYNVVRHPRADLAPMDLIGGGRRGSQWLGPLWDHVVTDDDRPPPELTLDEPAADIAAGDLHSANVRAGIAVPLLAQFLAPFGAADVAASYRSATRLSLGYENAKIDRVNPAQLASYIAVADLREPTTLLGEYLDGDLYVIDSVIKSSTLIIDVVAMRSVSSSLEVEAIMGAAGPRVKVERLSSSHLALRYTGDHSLAFGFTCFRVYQCQEGDLRLGRTEPGAVSYASAAADHEILQPTGGFVALEFNF